MVKKWTPRNQGDDYMNWWRDYIDAVSAMPIPLDDAKIAIRLQQAKQDLLINALKSLENREQELQEASHVEHA